MTHPYTYVVLRYVPDQGAGEGLNIGVVLYSAPTRHFGHKLDAHYERLSRTFAHFDGQTYRRSIANLLHVFRDTERHLSELPLLSDDRSLTEWLRVLMPDVGGSITFTPPRHGLADDLSAEVGMLFERMVESQKSSRDDASRRDDEQVWQAYRSVLSPAVSARLHPKSFTTSSVRVDFAHAIRNGAWHVVQPISMDFKQAESMQRKASQWVGTAVGLQGLEDLGTIYFLLGEPDTHRKAYERAKALLSQAPVRHEIVEERDAARLNRTLLDLIEHGE